jgi:hypothetical protein
LAALGARRRRACRLALLGNNVVVALQEGARSLDEKGGDSAPCPGGRHPSRGFVDIWARWRSCRGKNGQVGWACRPTYAVTVPLPWPRRRQLVFAAPETAASGPQHTASSMLSHRERTAESVCVGVSAVKADRAHPAARNPCIQHPASSTHQSIINPCTCPCMPMPWIESRGQRQASARPAPNRCRLPGTGERSWGVPGLGSGNLEALERLEGPMKKPPRACHWCNRAPPTILEPCPILGGTSTRPRPRPRPSRAPNTTTVHHPSPLFQASAGTGIAGAKPTAGQLLCTYL